MLRITVCDDDPVHLKLAEDLVRKTLADTETDISIRPFSAADGLLAAIRKETYAPDIAVLDIEMDEKDGITLAKDLNQAVPECRIIFLTSYLDYAQDAYEAEHIWFVVKKDADLYFPSAMNKAVLSLRKKEQPEGILVRENRSSIFVPADQILYISKVGRKAQIICPDREYYDTRKPADLIPENLKDTFIRCHQGFWVNRDMITELDHETFLLKGDIRVPISRTYKEEARRIFFSKYQLNK